MNRGPGEVSLSVHVHTLLRPYILSPAGRRHCAPRERALGRKYITLRSAAQQAEREGVPPQINTYLGAQQPAGWPRSSCSLFLRPGPPSPSLSLSHSHSLSRFLLVLLLLRFVSFSRPRSLARPPGDRRRRPGPKQQETAAVDRKETERDRQTDRGRAWRAIAGGPGPSSQRSNAKRPGSATPSGGGPPGQPFVPRPHRPFDFHAAAGRASRTPPCRPAMWPRIAQHISAPPSSWPSG